MPRSRTQWTALVGVVLLVASLAVPLCLGITLHPLGLIQALAGSVLLVSASALAFNGSRPVPLSPKRAVPAVLATTAANAVTPAGIGGNLVMMRIHKKSGLTSEQAAAAAGLRSTVGALVAACVTAIVASSAGVDLPSERMSLLLALLVVVVLGTVTVLAHETRRKVRESAGRFFRAIYDVIRRPRCAVSLIVGCIGVTLGQLIILQGAVHAVGANIALDSLLAALVGSTAARSAFPSPGGVGPVEAALVAGLTALGMHWEVAATAVAVYRGAGHWLPVLAGMLSMKALLRRQLV